MHPATAFAILQAMRNHRRSPMTRGYLIRQAIVHVSFSYTQKKAALRECGSKIHYSGMSHEQSKYST